MKAKDRQVGGQHYKTMGTEPWDVVDSWPVDQQIGFHRGNALKYLMRMGSKDLAEQDIKKAVHYLQKLTEILEGIHPKMTLPADRYIEVDNHSEPWGI